MHTETLEAIKRSAAIPSMPMIATRCYEMTSDPNCNYDRLVELLSTDPGMAADILRLSNSPLFGVLRQVASLKQAITLLGVKRLRDLVLSRYLVQKLDQIKSDSVDINYYWRRSLASGILASKFADTLAPKQRDEAFMAGLLADVGVVILARAVPQQYGPIAAHYRPLDDFDWMAAEKRTLDVTHGEVSGMVLEQWNLPRTLVSAVRLHHVRPSEIPEGTVGANLVPIIGGAGSIAKYLCEAGDPEKAAQQCVAAMEQVELSVSVLAGALSGIEKEIEGMAKMLGVDVINSKVFAAIGTQLSQHLATPATA